MAKKSTALATGTTPPAPGSIRDAAKGLATLPSVAAAIDQVEDLFDSRDTLVAALAGAPLNEGLAYVLNCIADPRWATNKLSTICKTMGISLFEVYDALKTAIYAKATLQAMQTVAARTPAIVEDVLVRAAPHSVTCSGCRGVGTVTTKAKPDAAPEPCESCGGTGRVDVLPDLDRQKFALSLGPLAPKATPMIALDNRSVTVNDHSADGFARMLAATDRVLHGRRDLIGEVVDAEGDGVFDAPDAPETPVVESPAVIPPVAEGKAPHECE